jgi:DHA1 family inner membrane transport protein
MTSTDINRFFTHVGIHHFASCMAGVFVFAVLLRQGVTPAFVFLSMAAIFCLRFSLRPLVLVVAKRIGLRGAMIAGTVLSSLQYLALARVGGMDAWLGAWIVATAGADVLYWMLYHVMFAAAGEQDKFGRQTGFKQVVMSVASIVGPPIGGLLLTWYSPIVAFSVAALLRVISALPLLGVVDPPFDRVAPPDAYRAGRFGATVFMTDGWVICSAGFAWGIIVFQGLGGRFDSLGEALALASLVGALGGFVLGRLVDVGRARRAVYVNVAAGVAIFLSQAAAGYDPARIVAALIIGALLGGFSIPSMMPAVYTAVQTAPCPLRFQIATEGGWDAGAIAASLTGAMVAAFGAPLQVMILLAIPMLFFQAWLLMGHYGPREDAGPAPAGVGAD